MPDDEPLDLTVEGTHCDDYLGHEDAMWFIFIERLPANLRAMLFQRTNAKAPQLFADYECRRVRVTMASRFGDLGISHNLMEPRGYFTRVGIDKLSNFGTTP